MNFPTWARNVIAAFIYGAANAISAVAVAPETFNLGAQWKKTLAMALVGGVLSAARYLEKWLAPVVQSSNPNPSNTEIK
jgi:hypothetical protein